MKTKRAAIGARPPADPNAEAWIRHGDEVEAPPAASPTVRLTIDVPPALRGRIKVTAFTRGVTVAVMLRELLEEAFPEASR